MKFRRIDDDTVRCIVSKEDMQQYGIALEDFFKNKGKIHDFLHTVVEKAEEEVGYEPKDGMLSMQIMPLSPNTISITFSENGNEDYESILENMKDVLPELNEEEKESDKDELDDVTDGLIDFEVEEDTEDNSSHEQSSEDNLEKDTGEFKKSQTKPSDFSKIVMIGFDKLEEMTEFCNAVNIDKTIKSDLYYLKNKQMYFIIIEKDRLSAKLFKHILVLATEYTSNLTDEAAIIAYIREHGECLIDKKAYRLLRKYM